MAQQFISRIAYQTSSAPFLFTQSTLIAATSCDGSNSKPKLTEWLNLEFSF
jgi:hypothetical protein